MAQQTADGAAQHTADQHAGEALSHALSAMAEAGRYGRDGTRIAAAQLGHRLGTAGGRAGHRVAHAATDAGHRLGSAYGALRSPEPRLWRTREVMTLVVAAMVVGAGLAARAYERRARLLQAAADTED